MNVNVSPPPFGSLLQIILTDQIFDFPDIPQDNRAVLEAIFISRSQSLKSASYLAVRKPAVHLTFFNKTHPQQFNCQTTASSVSAFF